MDLQAICKKAAGLGKQIDLSDCYYTLKRTHSRYKKPVDYYRFLANFVYTQCLTSIVEIGTAYGGSIMVMNKGIRNKDKSFLVTVDKNDIALNILSRYNNIHMVVGDALGLETRRSVRSLFSKSITVDLLFIDAVHTYNFTKRCISIYGKLMSPHFIILDDIRLNEGMVKLWSELQQKFPNRALDITEISNRKKTAGFGIIEWKEV